MGSEEEEEESLQVKLVELQKQLGKRQSFEVAVSSIKSILLQNYPSASPPLRKSIYSVVCRVATILQTRYTAPGFWLVGKGLFEEAQRLVTDSSERRHLNTCIAKANQQLLDFENQPEPSQFTRPRYHFEGHLTVDPEPPRPAWLVARHFLNAPDIAAALSQSLMGNTSITSETTISLMRELENHLGENFHDLEAALEASLQEIGVKPRGRPPASKDLVKKLPIVTVNEDVLVGLGSETKCAVCQEDLVINDIMQELPCKHLFHRPCVKPWLDKHNSCPICRCELLTDDRVYENQKKRDKEAEEDRKAAANAVRGGEYMGDQGFCSIECRCRQIFLDEMKEIEASTRAVLTSSRHWRSRGQVKSGRRRAAIPAAA